MTLIANEAGAALKPDFYCSECHAGVNEADKPVFLFDPIDGSATPFCRACEPAAQRIAATYSSLNQMRELWL